MENSKVVICLILVYFLRICNCQLPIDGQCFRNKSTSSSGVSISVKTIFCCRNFEPIGTNNTCKGCELGFTSDGSKCEPCPSGKYGEKCGEKCFCHDSERCHHKKGCVPNKKGKLVFGSSTTLTTIHNLAKDGTEFNSVIIFMISIAVIGIIVIIIWTVWRCRFNLLHFKKLQRRRKLIVRRHNVSNGLQIETEVNMEENDRNTSYAVINERNMIMFEC